MADVLGGKVWDILVGDVRNALATLPDGCVHCAVTSPPYWGLRDYGVPGQLGLEKSPYCWGWATGSPCGGCYCCRVVAAFREVRRVLRDDGTLWLNVGDGYASPPRGRTRGDAMRASTLQGGLENGRRAHDDTSRISRVAPGLKAKDAVGVPWALAFALRADGWYLRAECIWDKPNPMPESVRDRPSKAHEQVFLLSKRPAYFFDREAVRERSVDPESHSGRKKRNPDQFTRSDPNGKARTRAGFAHLEGKVYATRNLRSVLRIPLRGYSGAHFATFPVALPALAIRASTSERGVCPACGAPWRRVVEKERRPTRPGGGSKVYVPDPSKKQDALGDPRAVGFNARWKVSQEVGNRDPRRHCTITKTTGWCPGCACDAGPPIPALVLDPFLGSGTTLVAARRLGRRGLGVELSERYAALARRRVEGALRETKSRPAPPKDPGLFDHLKEADRE